MASTRPEQRSPGLPGDDVWRDCVRAAVAAPSIYNTQPWLFLLSESSVDVYADNRRRLLRVDPTGRELHVSLGAAVFNLRIALVARGFHVQSLLFPESRDRRLVARLRVIGHLNSSPSSQRLLAAIAHRRTSRRPFTKAPPPGLLEELAGAARAEGATLELLDRREREALFSLIRTAETQLQQDPEYVAELAQWTTDSDHRRDGVHASQFGVHSAHGAVPMRDFTVGRPGTPQVTEPYEAEPVVAVLTTHGDDPEHWVRAGMALERVLLEAAAAGLATSFMTQPLEIPELRDLYDERWLLQATQMILRIGYAEPSPPVPRREIDEVIVSSVEDVPSLR